MPLDFTHLARRADPHTSHEAARRAVAMIPSHEARVYGVIRDAWERGATANEIAEIAGMTGVQVNRRLGAMGKRGLIHRRRDDTGCVIARGSCAVWWWTR